MARLSVYGLRAGITEAEIRKVIEFYGFVESVEIRPGEIESCCFVTMPSLTEALGAEIALQGCLLDEKRLDCRLTERDDTSPGVPIKVQSRKDFVYDGRGIKKGDTFELEGKRNDTKLIGLKYVQIVKGGV